MSNYRVAARYAKSILDLSLQKAQLDAVHADFQWIAATVKESRDFALMLKSPIIKADDKAAVLHKLFDGKVNPITGTFLELLVKKGRESCLDEVADAFIEQYNIIRNTTRVKFISAVAVEKSVLDQIQAELKKDGTVGNIEWDFVVDPSLMGGFILEYNHKQYDASIASRLADLRRNIVDTSYVNKVVKQ